MTKKFLTGLGLAALLLGGACTVHQTEAPSLSGPSTFARSVTMTAIPDRITQDGASQSSVSALVIGPDGRPLSGVALRMDMMVGGQTNDYGTLSARTVVTGSDGVARVIYTAPVAPPPPANTSESTVSIRAVSVGSDAVADSSVTADIRLVPVGIILPPAGSPTAAFTMSPTPAIANIAVTFDGSTSTPGAGATSISSYSWNFGDGTATGSGRSVSHTFKAQQTFNVTLTVTNDRGVSASTTTPTVVGGLALPTPRFVFSPTGPSVGQSVLFNADQSTAAPGHKVDQFDWNFGDGATGSGSVASHTFAAVGTYNVVLTVIDDVNQRSTIAQTVSITSAGGGGGGGGATVAAFVTSPTAPVVSETVIFNASASTASAGRTLTQYSWDFGDQTFFTTSTAFTTHQYLLAGTFSVKLIVTDSTGQIAQVVNGVTVVVGTNGPVGKFTSSPTNPIVNQQVVFDASTSTTGAGQTLTDYAWNFGDGTPIVHTSAKTIAHGFATANIFTVNLTVTDSAGRTNSAAPGTVTVSTPVAGPVANFTFTPAVGAVGVPVSFTNSSTGSPVSSTWDFGDGTALSPVTSPSHTFTTAGTYSVTLTVTDAAGHTSTISKSLVVQ